MKYACIVLCIVFGFELSAGQYTNACPLTTCAYNYKQSIEEYRCYTNYNCPANHNCCKHECFLHKICIPANIEEAELTLITTPSAEVTIDIGNPEGRVCPTTTCDNKWKEWNEEIRCYSYKNCKENQLCCSHSCYNHKVCLDIGRMNVPSSKPEYSETCPNTKCSVQHKVTNLKFQCTDSLDCKYQYNCCKHDCFNHKICIRSNRITSVVVPPIEIGNDTSVNNNKTSQNEMEEDLQVNLPEFTIKLSSTTESVTVENISVEGTGAGPGDDSIDDIDYANFNTNDTVEIQFPTPSISTLSTNVNENDDDDFIIDGEDYFSKSTTTQDISTAEPSRTSTLIVLNMTTPHEIDKEQGSGSGSNIDNDAEVDDHDDEDDINSGEAINGNDFTEMSQITSTLSTITSSPTLTTVLNQETQIVTNIDNDDFIQAITTLGPGRIETNEEVIDDDISTATPSLTSTLIVLDATTPHEIDKEQGSGSGFNIDNDDEVDDHDDEDDINSGESINGNDFPEMSQITSTLSTITSSPTLTTVLIQETQIVTNIDNDDFIQAITTLEPGRIETNEEVIDDDISTATPSLTSTLIVLDVTTPHEIDKEQGSGSGSNIDNDDEVDDDDDEDDINSGEAINGNDFTEMSQVTSTLSTITSSPTLTTVLNQETQIVTNIDNDDFIQAITTLDPGRVETNEEVIDDISTAAPSLTSILIVLDATTPHEIDKEQGSGSGFNIDNDDEVDDDDDDDDEDDINSGESINGNHFTEMSQVTSTLKTIISSPTITTTLKQEPGIITQDNLHDFTTMTTTERSKVEGNEGTTGGISLPESIINPTSTLFELSTMQEFTDINGLGSGFIDNDDDDDDDDIKDNDGSGEDNEDVSSASGSTDTESDIYVDEGNKGVTTNRPSRSMQKLKVLSYKDIWNLCHGNKCSTAKVLPHHILKLISGNTNPNLLLGKEIDFVKKSLTANTYKEFDVNFSNENEEDDTETISNEFTCLNQVHQATHLLCHGNWNCVPGYYCKRHPCYSHYVCMNKEHNIQECPIIQEICDDSLSLMELKEFICDSNSHCTYSTSLLNNDRKLDNLRNKEFQCCPHECLPRHQICRQIENVLEEYKEMADVMAVSYRNSGNAAISRALLMNLVFMVVAGLIYLWLYLKK